MNVDTKITTLTQQVSVGKMKRPRGHSAQCWDNSQQRTARSAVGVSRRNVFFGVASGFVPNLGTSQTPEIPNCIFYGFVQNFQGPSGSGKYRVRVFGRCKTRHTPDNRVFRKLQTRNTRHIRVFRIRTTRHTRVL